MKLFLKLLFYVVLILILALVGITLFKRKPEIQTVFYFAAVSVLIYSLMNDELFPNKSLASKKRVINQNRKQSEM